MALTPQALNGALTTATVLVNSTRVGMQNPLENPLPEGVALRPGLTVLDMVYRPLETALLRTAREQGAATVDGLWMLVFQALEQLRLWTGIQVADEQTEALHRHLKGEAT
jgi:shikimate dehydrogenase